MKKLLFLLFALTAFSVNAQENIKYQKPSEEILNLVEFERPPSVLYDDQKNYMLFLYRDNYKSIEDLSAKDIRLAGLRTVSYTHLRAHETDS